jgi:type I restriction enzyme S subunit
VTATLGSVLTFKYGKALPEQSRRPGTVAVYGSNGAVGTHDIALTQGPAIIVGRKGSIGEVHYSEGPAWPIDTTYFIDEFGQHAPRFWFWYLKSLQLGSLNRATAIPGLNRLDAYHLQVAIPPVAEQHRIVAKLENLLQRSKSTDEELARVLPLIERYREAFLDRTFTAVALSAKRLLLNEIAGKERGIPYGIVQTGAPHPGGVPTVRAGDIKHFSIQLEQLKRVDPLIEGQYVRTRLLGGEVLLSIRGTVGNVAVAGPGLMGCNISREVAMIPPNPGVDPHYLMFYLASPEAQKTLVGHIKGVAQSGVNLSDLRSLSVPLPSFDVQTEIVRSIRTTFRSLQISQSESSRASSLLSRLDQATLSKAFRGELVPQDPQDAPVNILVADTPKSLPEVAKLRPRVGRPPRAPREKAAMTKSRYDDDVNEKPYLATLLKKLGTSTNVEELFKYSKLPVTDFYKQLSWEVKAGHIRDDQKRLEAA